MGQIDYTKRSVRLRDGAGSRQRRAPIVPDVSGQVAVARTNAEAWRATERIGDAVTRLGADLGPKALAVAADMMEREDERLVGKARVMVMGLHDRTLLATERDAEGVAAGLLVRKGEKCRGIADEGSARLKESCEAVAEELGLNDRQIGRLAKTLQPYALGCRGRLVAHEANEMLQTQLADAAVLYRKDVESIASGNDSDLMHETAIRDFDAYLRLKGGSEEQRAAEHGAFVRSLFAAGVARAADGFRTKEEFDGAIDAAEKDPKQLFMGNRVLEREMGGEVGDDLRVTLMDELRKGRDRLVGRQEHDRRLATRQIQEEFAKEELKLADEDRPDGEYADLYENWGHDERLRLLAPETAIKYLDTAERMRRAIKKGETAATEDALAGRLNRITFMELDGRYDGALLAGEQAAVWREFKTGMLAGKFREEFVRSFQGRLTQKLSDEEKNAMREFYAAFGYRGDLNADGEPGAKDRKDLARATFLAPVDETVPMTDEIADGRELRGAQLFELGDTFLRELRTLGPEAYRPEVMRKTLGEIKSRKMAEDFSRNRDELAQKIFDIQRNLKAGETQNGRTQGTGESADGKPAAASEDAED